MSYKKILPFFLLILLFSGAVQARGRLDVGDLWKFSLAHSGDYQKYYSFSNGPASRYYDDTDWKDVLLPYDWSVDLPFSVQSSHENGFKMTGWRFPENSVAWYRKHFTIPAEDSGNNITLRFEAVRGDCDIFCNGIHVGSRSNSSLPYEIDITGCVKFGGENVISVRVDAVDVQGPYYQGSGLVGDVSLIESGAVEIKYGEIVIDALNRIGTNAYMIDASVEVFRKSAVAEGVFSVSFSLSDASENQVAKSEDFFTVIPDYGQATKITRQLCVSNPSLWSDFRPYLYTLTCELSYNGEVVDRQSVKTGIRDIFFDENNGILLNGKPLRFNAVCAHQDFGAVGVAAGKMLWKDRLTRLKDLGCNAIRFYGEPVSQGALEACDELGFLVVEELRSEELSSASDAIEMVKRDSYHPSVFLWNVAAPHWELDDETMSDMLCKTVLQTFSSVDITRPSGIYSGNQKWMSGLFFTDAFNYRGSPEDYVWPRTMSGTGLLDYSGAVTDKGEKYREASTGKRNKDYENELKNASRAGRPFQIKAVPSKKRISADGEDVIVVDVTLVDEKGRIANSLEHELTVYVDARPLAPYGSSALLVNKKLDFDRVYIVGSSNGNPEFRDVEKPASFDDGEFVFKTYKGRATVVLRSVSGSKKKAHVRIGGSRLHGASLTFEYL